jgi:hypothetical protein
MRLLVNPGYLPATTDESGGKTSRSGPL